MNWFDKPSMDVNEHSSTRAQIKVRKCRIPAVFTWIPHISYHVCGNILHYFILGGTGMITSSSTFCPHPGRVIRDLFRQLHVVWHGTGALVHSNHPREAAASSYLAIILGRITSGVPGVETNRD